MMGDAQTVTEALRTLVCAVDESAEHIDELLHKGLERTEVAELGDVVERMVSNVLHRRDLDHGIFSPSQSPAVFAVGIAFAAQRIEHATPFREGDDTYDRKTTIDIERPLLENPGGSGALHRLRTAFQNTLGELFDQHSGVRRLVAQLLLTPTDDTPRLATAKNERDHQVTFGEASNGVEYVRLLAGTATRWVRIVPKAVSGETFHPTRQDDEYVFIPVEILREKFRAYVGHGFDRLVHRGFHQFRDWRWNALKSESWNVEKEIHDKYLTNNIRSLYGTCRYDTSGASTGSAASQSPGFSPVVHNHQLVNIVDVIRSNESLSFDGFVTASEIYEAALTVFPPPHRPSLTLNSVQRIAQVLRSASDTDGQTVAAVDCRERQNDGRNVLEYCIEEPRYTPFYTPLPDEKPVNRWDAYRHIRAEYTSIPLGDDTKLPPGVRADAGTEEDPLVAAKRDADALVATQSHSRPLEAIKAAVRPADFDLAVEVTQSELRSLTRIVYLLNGLVQDRTLTDGMVEFKKTPDGDVSDALLSKDLLKAHTKGYQTVYSVPSDVVEALGLELFSHETFGERGDETGLHRYGIALLAYALAQRDDVDTVHRYVDLWRLDYDDTVDQVTGETSLEMSPDSLDWRRVDVVAFRGGDPVYVGEFQISQKNKLVRRNWEKLRLLAENGPEAVWLMPDFDRLASIIRTLQDEGCVADATLPSTERVSVWQQSFERKDLYNRGIAEFHTLRSLYREVDLA
jgi:hypothetical protein